MFKSLILIATIVLTTVASKHSHHKKLEAEGPKLMATNWNVEATVGIIKKFHGPPILKAINTYGGTW